MASLEDRLRGLPRVQSVGWAMSLPPDLLVMSNNYTVEGAASNAAGPSHVAEWNVVNPDYFTAMGIRVLHGRAFDSGDRAEAPAWRSSTRPSSGAISPAAPHSVGGSKEATGTPQSPWITIVGVVTDVPYENGAWGGPKSNGLHGPVSKPVAAVPLHCH